MQQIKFELAQYISETFEKVQTQSDQRYCFFFHTNNTVKTLPYKSQTNISFKKSCNFQVWYVV